MHPGVSCAACLLRHAAEDHGRKTSIALQPCRASATCVSVTSDVSPGILPPSSSLACAEHLVRGKLQKAERLYKKLLADGQSHLNALANYGYVRARPPLCTPRHATPPCAALAAAPDVHVSNVRGAGCCCERRGG